MKKRRVSTASSPGRQSTSQRKETRRSFAKRTDKSVLESVYAASKAVIPKGAAGSGSSSNSSSDPCNIHQILSFAEASSPRYRKIGLNGFPISDGRPQGKPESDEESEETYVDALNCSLRHDTSDIYVPLVGGELPFSIKRSVTAEVFYTGPSVPYYRMYDRPFGVCWTSGVTANVKLSHAENPPSGEDDCPAERPQPDLAYVTDESGAVFTFILLWDEDSPFFLPIASYQSEQDNFFSVLTINNPEDSDPSSWNYTFTKRYGSVLTFVASGLSTSYQPDPDNSSYMQYNYYACLQSFQDRYGATMSYTYGIPNSLIPSQIQAPDGRTINISSSDGYRVHQITVPHELYHAGEYQALAAGYKGPAEFGRAIDPYRMGTTSPSDANMASSNGLLEVPTHERRAVRFSNIVARQDNPNANIQTGYPMPTIHDSWGRQIPGYVPIPNPLGTHFELSKPSDPP